VATFADPNVPLSDRNPDVNPANQYGVPIGVLSDTVTFVHNTFRGFAYAVYIANAVGLPSFMRHQGTIPIFNARHTQQWRKKRGRSFETTSLAI
jgi:hypothetical protein